MAGARSWLWLHREQLAMEIEQHERQVSDGMLRTLIELRQLDRIIAQLPKDHDAKTNARGVRYSHPYEDLKASKEAR